LIEVPGMGGCEYEFPEVRNAIRGSEAKLAVRKMMGFAVAQSALQARVS
jgi:hypothetical protein